MQHPWMLGNLTTDKELPQEFIAQMKAFNARRKLRRSGLMVIAANRFKNILKQK
jgi:hypothetical protein